MIAACVCACICACVCMCTCMCLYKRYKSDSKEWKPVLQFSTKAVGLHYAEGQIATYDLLRVNSYTLAPLLKHKMSGLRV